MMLPKLFCERMRCFRHGIADYEGKSRAEILRLVSTFHDSFKEDGDFCAVLQKVMHVEDWEEMLTTPPFEIESEIAPTD